jgi:hypothetical protein
MEYWKIYKYVLKERNVEEQNRSLGLRLEIDDGDNEYLQVPFLGKEIQSRSKFPYSVQDCLLISLN